MGEGDSVQKRVKALAEPQDATRLPESCLTAMEKTFENSLVHYKANPTTNVPGSEGSANQAGAVSDRGEQADLGPPSGTADGPSPTAEVELGQTSFKRFKGEVNRKKAKFE